MIAVNNILISQSTFPDGTLAFKSDEIRILTNQLEAKQPAVASIAWKFENNSELFTVRCLKRYLDDIGVLKVSLYMPYIPNARMDRTEEVGDIFTLKYFCEEINSLNFDFVFVLDPHSNVAPALLDRCIVKSAEGHIKEAINYIKNEFKIEDLVLVYPDSTAVKRYSKKFDNNYIQGIKSRSWNDGKIDNLTLVGDLENIKDKDVLIVDDICCRGGTFMKSAKELKELGARKIFLYVSHCENTIFSGEILESDLIDTVFTTDSIFSGENDKILISSIFKQIEDMVEGK